MEYIFIFFTNTVGYPPLVQSGGVRGPETVCANGSVKVEQNNWFNHY